MSAVIDGWMETLRSRDKVIVIEHFWNMLKIRQFVLFIESDSREIKVYKL